MGAYEATYPVRFGQVDAAGILFYPRVFERFHAVFEDMFTDLLGVPYMSLLTERRIGFPTVNIETTYDRPFRFGDPMRLLIDVVHVGRTSIGFRYRAFNGEEPAPSVHARATVVVCDMDTFEPLPVPDDIRAALESIRADDVPADIT